MPTNCSDLQQKLQLIKESFSNPQKFQKGLLPGSTYKHVTSLTICGVMGEMSTGDDGSIIVFKFRSKDFEDKDGKLTFTFVNNFREAIKNVFGAGFEENYGKDKDDQDQDYEYYEYSPATETGQNIVINFPFSNDHCWITFKFSK